MKRKIPKAKSKAIGQGVHKLAHEYKETGTMRTSRATYHPKSMANAQAIAAAIEYGKHGVGRAGAKHHKKPRWASAAAALSKRRS